MFLMLGRISLVIGRLTDGMHAFSGEGRLSTLKQSPSPSVPYLKLTFAFHFNSVSLVLW